MYKNQLQELAQRSCFNLPCYTCIREGPDHAPRFKATVSFNGEVFESPGYHTTLRQAEHAAAEVALTTLSQRGPTQSLAARILDETGVCKNLLQETAQRSGLSLPVYTTIRLGPRHQPLFKCVVEIGGRHFKGEPAKTKKQAEKNAAMAAWTALSQSANLPHASLLFERPEGIENGEAPNVSPFHNTDGRPSNPLSLSQSQFRSRMPTAVRDRSRANRDHSTVMGQCHPCLSSTATVEASNTERGNCYMYNQQPLSSSVKSGHEMGLRVVNGNQSLGNPSLLTADANFESAALGQRGAALHHAHASAGSSSRRQGRRHQRRHSLSGMESPMLSREAAAASRASGGGNMFGKIMLQHQQQQIRGLPYQSLSERFDLKRPSLLEELQQREEEDDWFHAEQTPSLSHRQNIMTTGVHSQGHPLARRPLQSHSDRFELRTHYLSPLEQVHLRDDDEWLCAGTHQGTSRPGKEKSLGLLYGHMDGWLQDGAVLNGDLKVTNPSEGWMRGDVLKQSLDVERGWSYREGWLRNNGSQQSSEKERDPIPKQDHACNYGYQEGWRGKAPVSGVVEHGRIHSQDSMFNNTLQSEQGIHSASSTTATSSSSSPFSSLWSKSTQWWGSHMPSNTSSAAAAVASTLGFRPPRSAAPVVKVRQMIPVCSAPPPRHPDTPGWRHPSLGDPVCLDNESEACQALSNLRI